MTATLAAITVDCDDVERAAGFWAAVLDRKLGGDPTPYFASLAPAEPSQPTWMFLKVPEPKTAKNRLHVDLTAPDRDAEVARMVELGATRVREVTEYGMSWVVMNDPEGNEYCVAQSDPH
ncbi:VOC family protein [Pseudonocardia humida]|uniref:VOC family protein n=1 Tax=Pseudonocardia humida TaxID=2800819 RepID=UPI00207CE43E|nr:VOC family protein [Pseudonocardia humida]